MVNSSFRNFICTILVSNAEYIFLNEHLNDKLYNQIKQYDIVGNRTSILITELII